MRILRTHSVSCNYQFSYCESVICFCLVAYFWWRIHFMRHKPLFVQTRCKTLLPTVLPCISNQLYWHYLHLFWGQSRTVMLQGVGRRREEQSSRRWVCMGGKVPRSIPNSARVGLEFSEETFSFIPSSPITIDYHFFLLFLGRFFKNLPTKDLTFQGYGLQPSHPVLALGLSPVPQTPWD